MAALPHSGRDQAKIATAVAFLPKNIQKLILDMKRGDPGRSARLIVRELAGRITAGQ